MFSLNYFKLINNNNNKNELIEQQRDHVVVLKHDTAWKDTNQKFIIKVQQRDY